MNWAGALLITGTVALSVAAQSRHKVDIDAETPQGQLLQQIGQEQDAAKKVALLEEFLAKHGQHPGAAWVLGQLQPAYLGSKQYAKVFPVVEKLLALDPGDAEMAYGGLQAAVALDDPDAILKWATLTNEAAKKGVKTPKPEDEDDVPKWKYRVDFSEQVQKRCEYEVFTGALRATDPAKRILLAEGLAQLNAESEYLPQLEGPLFIAYRQANQNEKALALAEKAAGRNTADEDMLLLLANAAFEKKDFDKTVQYGTKAAETAKAKTAPAGVNAAEWEKKRNTTMGAAWWLVGMMHASKSQWGQVDTVLRQALPLIEGNDLLVSHALFQLGLANHRMGEKGDASRIQAAYDFFRRCSTIKGPNQGMAAKNVAALRASYRGLK